MSDLIVRTAGNAANPVVAQHTDLPVTDRGLLVVRADLRMGTDERRSRTLTVPNAQHAVRQGRLLARNLVSMLRGPRHRLPAVRAAPSLRLRLGRAAAPP